MKIRGSRTGDPKFVNAHAVAGVASSGSAVGTIVSSGTAFVPVKGQAGAIQPVVIPQVEIGLQRFREEVAKLRAFVQEAVMDGGPDQSGFYVEEIELHLDVTAEGGLRVMGSGVDAGAAAGIKVVLRRGRPGAT